jgi:hypothetical protein
MDVIRNRLDKLQMALYRRKIEEIFDAIDEAKRCKQKIAFLASLDTIDGPCPKAIAQAEKFLAGLQKEASDEIARENDVTKRLTENQENLKLLTSLASAATDGGWSDPCKHPMIRLRCKLFDKIEQRRKRLMEITRVE